VPSDPDTVTVVAFSAVTLNVEVAPATIEVGAAEIFTVGTGGGPAGVTTTVAVAVTVPPAPVTVAV
jgi:hypothetical protein